MAYQIERNGLRFTISGRFGSFHVYHGSLCVMFGLMTKDDAENWIWKNFPQ